MTMAEEIKKFKLREEKHVMTEVEYMAWSPSMDLLALGNKNGEVIVNRLSWQRVWSLSAPSEGDKVGGLAWRPDGKVIAVGYKSGIIRVCDVEKGDQVYIAAVKGAVTNVVWLEQSKQLSEGEEHYAEDNSENYLPSAKQQQTLYSERNVSKEQSGLEAYERFRYLTSQKELNLLIVGSDASEVSIFSYGAFPTAIVDLSSDEIPECMSVDDALISPDLSCLSIILKSTVEGIIQYRIKTMDTNLLIARHEEIRLLAAKYVMVASAQMELQVIIQQMCEAWEDILREMDSRLLKLAETKRKRADTSVGNDFLELLLFGTTSLDFESFLLTELTDKGLKKLGFSVENSYSNIQKLVVRQLQRVSQNITAHLSDLHGMSQWYDRYAVLGLRPEILRDAVRTAGAFSVSGSELQQVIDASMKNFKAFFRWLYIAIMRLSNEQLPPDLAKMTQHDINFVAEFLRDNFGEPEDPEPAAATAGDEGKSKPPQVFRLEKVGQYLKNEDVTQPPNYHENPWIQFLNAATFHKDSKVLYPSMLGKSLLQRKELLDKAVGNAVLEPAKVIGASMSPVSCFSLFSVKESPEPSSQPPKVCQFTDEDLGCIWTAYVQEYFPCKFLYIMCHPVSDVSSVELIKIHIGRIGDPDLDDSIQGLDRPPSDEHVFLDFAMFNSQTLTLLLSEAGDEEVSLLLQLPLSVLPKEHFTHLSPAALDRDLVLPALNAGPLLPAAGVNYQTNASGLAIAVGGIRTTASLLLKSQRRIRLFLLEEGDGDDDDDEDEDGPRSEAMMTMSRDGENGGDDDDKENMAD
ncbi:anaphase-promoting complex subunit 4 [Aplysia californica]|uniref:Anaphase-promoting complex subunit 4 n=1 Tax=Aplysia californica TaxID=6500 RepID=A0ABM1A4C5_APLCA|nr:anaphase-promoting complex subunit 4 [Aplysia californica]